MLVDISINECNQLTLHYQ